jgi:hypothetical protein
MGVVAGIAVPSLLILLHDRRRRDPATIRGSRSLVLLPVLAISAVASAYQYAVIAGERSCQRMGLLGLIAAPTLAFVVVLVVLLMAALFDESGVVDRTASVVLKVIYAGVILATTIALQVNFLDAQQIAGNSEISMADVIGYLFLPIAMSIAGAYVRESYRNSEISDQVRSGHPFFRMFMLVAGAIVLASQALFGLAAGVTAGDAGDVGDWFVQHSNVAALLYSTIVGTLMMMLTMAYPRLLDEPLLTSRLTGPGEALVTWWVDDDEG